MAQRQDILDSIVLALNNIKKDTSYESEIKQVSMFDDNILKKKKYQIPLVMVLDTGIETPVKVDATHTRYQLQIGLYGLVKTTTDVTLHEELNKLVSTIKQFINSSPTLDSSVLKFEYLNTEGIRYWSETLLADVMINCRITYVAEERTTVVSEDIHSNPWTETAQDKLTALLTTLMADMATDGDDPLFSYIYESHDVANLLLNAVSIQLEDAEPTGQIANDRHIRYMMNFSIRVHTDYIDGINDANKNRRLLNSVLNKLKENIILNDNYRTESVKDINVKENFEDSATVGGSLMAAVSVSVQFDQE